MAGMGGTASNLPLAWSKVGDMWPEPRGSSALGPERFLHEIKLAARPQHPHILTVYDSGDGGGRLWFTMPFVEGRARATGSFPQREADSLTYSDGAPA